MHRLGVVSFLNARPLVHGLCDRPDVRVILDVPSQLPARLETGEVDVALVPVIDVIRSLGALRVISDAGIACDGETMTVRVFSQIPPDRIAELWVDGDSHTSIALACVLWRELFGRTLTLHAFDARTHKLDQCKAVLLIGDKVVRSGRSAGFAYEMDLGGAWRQHTGLPFVFAVWAAPAAAAGDAADAPRIDALTRLLETARDSGVLHAREIAERDGPPRWWPTDLAVRYLTRCLQFRLDQRYVDGANQFARLCARYDVAPAGAEILWPPAPEARLSPARMRSSGS